MLINVTQEDIDRGCRFGSLGLCPVELAMQRATGKIWCVDGAAAKLKAKSAADKWIELPQEAKDFIFNFDRPPLNTKKRQPQPFSFSLEIDDECLTSTK